MQDDARCSLCCPSPRSWWVPGCGQKRKSGSIQAVPQLQSAHEMGCTTPQLPCFWCLAGRRHWFRRARSWLLPRVPPAAGRRRWSISTTPLGKIVLRCARGNLLARCAVPRFCFYFTCIVAVASSLLNVAAPPEQRRSTAVLPNLTSPAHDWRSIARPTRADRPAERTAHHPLCCTRQPASDPPAQLGGGITTQISRAHPPRPIGVGNLPPGTAYIYPGAHIGQPQCSLSTPSYHQGIQVSCSLGPGGRQHPLPARPPYG
jgi:hypothetical protein